MADHAALNAFLQSVERRALRMAELAVRNRDDALDIVQDAMIALARGYAERPVAEWAPLFHRILASRITDFCRRRTVRQRLFGAPSLRDDEDQEATDPFARVAGAHSEEPEFRVRSAAASERLVELVGELPVRQQQAFLLRVWEGFDVAATAAAMGCSEGSVKTHLSRAVHALRARLDEYWE